MGAIPESAVYNASHGIGWHGIGEPIEAGREFDAEWVAGRVAPFTIQRRPLYLAGGVQVSGFMANVIEGGKRDGNVLAVTSENRYHVGNRQPIDLIAATLAQFKASGVTPSHAMSMYGGGVIVVSGKVESIDGPDRETISLYVNAFTGYDGQRGTGVRVTGVREVCQNTMAMSEGEAQRTGRYRNIRASTQFDADTLPALLAGWETMRTQTARTYDQLANTAMSDADVLRFFADTVGITIEDLHKTDKGTGKPVVSTKARNMLDALRASYVNAPGASQGTAWGAYNAVTHFATHVRTTRDTNGDGQDVSRAASNMFGDSARMKANAMGRLLALPVAA